MTSLIAVGDNTWDVYRDQQVEYPGGNALNVAVFASRLGAGSAYLGALAADHHGQRLLDCLRAEHVDISRCRTLPGESGWACVDSIKGERVFLGSAPGVSRQLRLDTHDLSFIADFPLAHTSLYSGLDDQLAQIRQASGCLSFDFSDNWDEFDWHALIGHVDIAFFSAALLSDTDAYALAQSMRARGPSIVVVTRGALGALAIDAHGTYEQPSVPCTVVDSMGAGDGFIAAFLLASQAHCSLPDCLAQGVKYAAQVCGWPGAFGQGQSVAGERLEQLNQALTPQH